MKTVFAGCLVLLLCAMEANPARASENPTARPAIPGAARSPALQTVVDRAVQAAEALWQLVISALPASAQHVTPSKVALSNTFLKRVGKLRRGGFGGCGTTSVASWSGIGQPASA